MSEQDGIDWGALAKAAYESDSGIYYDQVTFGYDHEDAHVREAWQVVAHAVIAAYREQRAAQGFVEVRRSTGRPDTRPTPRTPK